MFRISKIIPSCFSNSRGLGWGRGRGWGGGGAGGETMSKVKNRVEFCRRLPVCVDFDDFEETTIQDQNRAFQYCIIWLPLL